MAELSQPTFKTPEESPTARPSGGTPAPLQILKELELSISQFVEDNPPARLLDKQPPRRPVPAAPAAPAARPGAILGLVLLTAFVLWIAGRAVRRMQISYAAET